MSIRNAVQLAVLLGIGCLQMLGDVTGSTTLKALGVLSHASPAPKVFTAQQGFETYSPRFYVWAYPDDRDPVRLHITPAVNARVRGPYNRRNAYGAALSYGPVLARAGATRPMFETVFEYALCDPRGVAREIGVPDATRYAVEVVPRSARARVTWPTRFEVDCKTGAVQANGAQS